MGPAEANDGDDSADDGMSTFSGDTDSSTSSADEEEADEHAASNDEEEADEHAAPDDAARRPPRR